MPISLSIKNLVQGSSTNLPPGCDADTDPAAARCPVSPRRHGGHGDFTEASGFSVHLRVLRVSVVNKALKFFSSLASRNSSGPVILSGAQNESFRANCQVRASEVVLVISPKSESVGVVIGVPRLA